MSLTVPEIDERLARTFKRMRAILDEQTPLALGVVSGGRGAAMDANAILTAELEQMKSARVTLEAAQVAAVEVERQAAAEDDRIQRKAHLRVAQKAALEVIELARKADVACAETIGILPQSSLEEALILVSLNAADVPRTNDSNDNKWGTLNVVASAQRSFLASHAGSTQDMNIGQTAYANWANLICPKDLPE